MRAKFLVPALFLLGTFLFLPGLVHAENWVSLGLSDKNPVIVAADIGNKDHILVGAQPVSSSEVDYTYDGGKTWAKSSITGTPCNDI